MKTKEKNPKCPYSKNDCIDVTDDMDCKVCHEYGNGVRATGAMPILSWILNLVNRLT